MVKQIDMDEYYRNLAEQTKNKPLVEIKKYEDNYKGLSERQIALKEFFETYQENHNSNPSDHDTLTNIDDKWYGYFEERKRKPNAPFNDLSSRRELTEDKNALAFHTGTTKVFIGNGYAKNDWEIKKQILKYQSSGKKQFRKMAICQMKALKNGQLGFDLTDPNAENEISKYESKIKQLDFEIKEIEETIKNIDESIKGKVNKNDKNYN